MLERFKLMLKLLEKEDSKKRNLMHVAITTNGVENWALENKKGIEEAYKKSFGRVIQAIEMQIKRKIPVLTIYLLPERLKKEERFSVFIGGFVEFLDKLKEADVVHKNKIKVSAFGKWYDIPGRAVEQIKKVLEGTRDYDCFFVNFCINYDGQEEIADACRLIARQINAGKLDVDSITKETIKENIYSSYFLPPDIIIKNGTIKRTSGLLLWDSVNSEIYFSGKNWPDFSEADFDKAVEGFGE